MQKDESIPALLLQIKSQLSSLTKSEQTVAQYILDHPNEVLDHSLYGLAECCNTSDATVIRTFRKLGMDSFHELKINLAQSMVSPIKLVSSDISQDDPVDVVIGKIYSGITNTISMTKDLNQNQELVAAAEALFNARSIHIFGFGGSRSVADDFYHKMLRLGLSASFHSDLHLQRMTIENFVTEKDVAFAISHSGSSKHVVDAAKLCKAKGATVITLTDVAKSPLKKEADISLCTMSEETKYNLFGPSSKIASYAVIDIVYLLISYLHPKETMPFINSSDASMKTLKY